MLYIWLFYNINSHTVRLTCFRRRYQHSHCGSAGYGWCIYRYRSYRGAVINSHHYLRLFDDEVILEKELFDFTANNKLNLGLVSLNAPLISNLDVWVNIALVKQYHENLSKKTSMSQALQYLQRYRMEDIANKRNSALTHKERFIVMLLRAAMVKDALMVLDRPFMIIPDVQDDRYM